MENIDSRRHNQQTQYELRKQIVRLRKKGLKNSAVAEIVGITQSHASTIWQKYLKDGLQAIKPGIRGRQHGAQRTLTTEQEEALQRLLVDKTPDQLKLPFALWTRDAVRSVIKQRYRLDLPARSVGNYLKRGGILPRNQPSWPMSKTHRGWLIGLRTNTPQSLPVQNKRKPKSIGATKPA